MQSITVKQFAKNHDISEEMTRKLIAHRELGVIRIGRCVRIPVSEAQRYIERNTVPSQ